MNNDKINVLKRFNNKQRKSWLIRFKDIFDKPEQSIYANKHENPTGTLVTTLLNPVGGANPYSWFGYVPQNIYFKCKEKYQYQ